MTATGSDMRDVLVPWFSSVSGLSRVEWGYQSQPRSNTPYASIRFFSYLDDKGRGPKESRRPSADSGSNAQEIVGNEEFILTCFVIGEDGTDLTPLDALNKVVLAVSDPEANLTLLRRQTSIVKVATVANGTVYTITIENVPVTYTSSVAATDLEIRNGLVAAINANDYISELSQEPIVASDGLADDLLSITCYPGIEFEISLDSRLELDSNVGAVGLYPVRTYGINNVTRAEDSKYRARAQLDIQFRISVRRFTTIYTIDEVEGEILGEEFSV